MPTSKELLEAQKYFLHRVRRTINEHPNFSSSAPQRSTLLALSLLAALAALIGKISWAYFSPNDVLFSSPGRVIKTSDAQYLAINHRLYPISGSVNALLFSHHFGSESKIENVEPYPRGRAVGLTPHPVTWPSATALNRTSNSASRLCRRENQQWRFNPQSVNGSLLAFFPALTGEPSPQPSPANPPVLETNALKSPPASSHPKGTYLVVHEKKAWLIADLVTFKALDLHNFPAQALPVHCLSAFKPDGEISLLKALATLRSPTREPLGLAEADDPTPAGSASSLKAEPASAPALNPLDFASEQARKLWPALAAPHRLAFLALGCCLLSVMIEAIRMRERGEKQLSR